MKIRKDIENVHVYGNFADYWRDNKPVWRFDKNETNSMNLKRLEEEILNPQIDQVRVSLSEEDNSTMDTKIEIAKLLLGQAGEIPRSPDSKDDE